MTLAPVSERLGFGDLVDRLAAQAPARDTERLLFDDLRPELRARKIGAIRLPDGSRERLPLTEFFQFVRELAAADSNLAHSLRNHYAAIENAILDPTPSSPRLLALAADGLLFGGAAQDRTGSSGAASETKAERLGQDEYLVSCRRYYATGSRYADYLTVSVTLDDGVARTVFIESDRPGVGLPDDWDGFGQRLTGSGSIVLDQVRITGADFFERPVADQERPRYPFTFNQVYLTSVVAGIANRALRDAVELVGNRTRNYYHGTTARTSDEPVVLAAIGVASAKAFAATATISAAAALLERSWDAPHDFELSLEATLAASRAKITVEALALDVIDALTQVASGSTLSTERALDRHWRNVKVLASHNPSIYKQQVLGGYEVHGTRPPLSIYFLAPVRTGYPIQGYYRSVTVPNLSATPAGRPSAADALHLLTSLADTTRSAVDPLATREDAVGWLRAAGLLPADADAALSGSEHGALLRLRDSLGDVLAARSEGRADADAAARLTRALADGRLIVTIDPAGAAGLASSARALYSNLVAAIAIAIARAIG